MASSSREAPVPAPPQTQEVLQTLRPHHSRLPGGLYLLSFCPPLPSPFREPRAFAQHPGVLYACGFVSAVIAGLGILSLDVLYGRVWTAGITGPGVTPEQIRSVSTRTAIIMAIVSVVFFVLCWLFLACFTAASAMLTQRLRHAYVASVLSQDAAYHDRHGAGEVATHAGKECATIRTAMGEKLSFVVWSLSTLVSSLTVGFISSSRVAGTLFALIPFCVLLFAFLATLAERIGGPMLRLEGRASSFLEECLGGVRVTQAFGMREHLIERFDNAMLKPLARLGMKRAAIRGSENGTFYTTLFLSYAVAFFAIAHYRGETGPSLTAFWNSVNSLFALANVVPMLSSLVDATTAINHLRRTIERVPLIDVRDPRGLRLELNDPPTIELKNVVMAYPSRPNVPSLDDVSVRFEAGKVTALVGQSGSGKSTITELLMRAYDPLTANLRQASDEADDAADRAAMGEKPEPKQDEEKPKRRLFGARTKSTGSAEDPEQGHDEKKKPISEVPQVQGAGAVFLDGHDLRDLNLSWLRSQIAVVRQMPQITSASIFENVAAGLTGTELEYRPHPGGVEAMDADAKLRYEQIRERVSAALIKAQAFDFVSRLPAGMDTQVSGGKTGLLSGGQRQRIAIARALIREPKLLILDEGTSALDSQSEALIRDMLQEEQRRRGMTTILIAHRLSTIAHADQIIVMRSGRVIDRASTTDEASAHTQLMDPKRDVDVNLYRTMVLTQRHIATAENDSSIKSGLVEETDDDDTSSLELLDSDGVTTRVAAQSTVAPSQPTASSLQQRPVPLSHRTSRASEHLPVQLTGRGATTMAHVEQAAAEEGAKGTSSKEERAELKRQGKRERRRLLAHFGGLLRRYWFLFLVGLIGAMLVGAAFPIAGWLTGGAVNALTIDRLTENARRVHEANRFALYFFILAVSALVLVTIHSCALEFASERLLRRLKRQSFAAVIHQEIGFFDAPENQAGSLTAAVSSSPASVAAATGLTSSQLIVSCTNLVGGVLLAFILDWKASVVCLAPLLVLFFSSWANVVMLERYESKVSVPAGKAATYIAENVDAMKEIAALGREPEVMRRFDEQARTEPKRTQYLIYGAGGFAISQMAVLAISALIFYWCGARLFADGELSQTNLFAIFEAVVISVFSAGRLLTFTPDIGRAAASFRKIVAWTERQPRIAELPPTDHTFTGQGDIVFSGVELRYPQRPDHPALTGLDLVIKSGQTHAFVGPSGAGKSTILQICARFYDPFDGTLSVGGVDVRTVPVEEFREKIGLVSQDPVLISGSIGWNISLGSPDPASVTRAQLEEACEQACILDFIRSLPDGFDTDVGGKGAQLSGGQKQRLCIARALIRDPKILLLDEATSALDAEAEVSVQQALARASTGRTCVTIAHRLSTVRKAHCIHVVEDGRIIESGTHDQLLARRGRYLELIEAQL